MREQLEISGPVTLLAKQQKDGTYRFIGPTEDGELEAAELALVRLQLRLDRALFDLRLTRIAVVVATITSSAITFLWLTRGY